eukprot:6800427-Pyramimonas_sp.AAC.1
MATTMTTTVTTTSKDDDTNVDDDNGNNDDNNDDDDAHVDNVLCETHMFKRKCYSIAFGLKSFPLGPSSKNASSIGRKAHRICWRMSQAGASLLENTTNSKRFA